MKFIILDTGREGRYKSNNLAMGLKAVSVLDCDPVAVIF